MGLSPGTELPNRTFWRLLDAIYQKNPVIMKNFLENKTCSRPPYHAISLYKTRFLPEISMIFYHYAAFPRRISGRYHLPAHARPIP
ncbi:hypothetical protein SXCC_01445 [Gluconacetobacter sp. SXCC-1]|nr:hypothetical protein SXCC_01445 [Gluconacetobacter sp. SXCC-1]